MPSSNSLSPLRNLFLTEAILKVLGGASFILFPTTILKNLVAPPHTQISILLIRSLGTQTIAFSVPLFLAVRSWGGLSKEARRLVYWTLLAREGFLMCGFLGAIGTIGFSGRGSGSDKDSAERELEEGKARDLRIAAEDEVVQQRRLRKGLWLWVAELVPFVVGRVWILTQKEEWF